ncbi:MAG: SDR family oxidoreductase [Alphaproteobacteria bacterium]|nr:SDR family oxidoreductase [Alphaproteobacteria bacterium]
MSELFNLEGRVALITGAGQGIGREIALVLAAHGANVAINDYSPTRAEEAAAAVRPQGREVIVVPGDVTDYRGVHSMVAEVEARLGRLDILVNNAGNAGALKALGDWKPFWETEPDEWHHWLGVNLDGVLNCCRAALPGMIERRFGRLILVSSDAGRVGEPHFAVYSAAKAGAMGLMRALAKAGGRHGITANSIALGGVDTPGAQSILTDDAAIRRMLSHYVIRRVGRPSDAAAMVLLLASDAGEWITGQTYPVNGGYSFAQ